MSEEKRSSFIKDFFDDFMLLLFLGVTIYAASYLVWGLMELAWLPPIPDEIKQSLLGR